MIGFPAGTVKTVFVKIRIELGMVRGKAKLFVWLVSDGIPGLADLVAVTMQFVLPDAVKTFVEESNEQPLPKTVKETAPVPEPPEEIGRAHV